MERKEIEGILNLLGLEKERLDNSGESIMEIVPLIGLTVIAQQLMLLVENTTRQKVDHERVAEDIIGDIEEQTSVDSLETSDPECYKDLVSSVKQTLEATYK